MQDRPARSAQNIDTLARHQDNHEDPCRFLLDRLSPQPRRFCNDSFWAIVLMVGKGPKMPITSALNGLKGQFFTDYNLLAAGAVIVALPTLIVFFALQKQFISGLTLGSTKG